MIALALPAAANEGGFVPPTLEDMHLPEILPWAAEYGTGFGKQMLLVLLSVALIAWFFLAASRRGQLVPGKLQHLGEMSYNFVRNSVGKDIIGERDYRPYVPLLFSLFFFILVNNLFGSIPLLQIPTPSHVGTAYALAGIVYITWIVLGLKKHGIGVLVALIAVLRLRRRPGHAAPRAHRVRDARGGGCRRRPARDRSLSQGFGSRP